MSEPQLFEDYHELGVPPFAHPGSAFEGMLNATPVQPPHDSPLSSWNRDRTTPSRSAPGALHKHANPLRSRVHLRLDMSGAGQPERYRTPAEAELADVETPAAVLAAFPAGLHPSSSFEAQHLSEGAPAVSAAAAAAASGAFAVVPPVSGGEQQQQQQERSPQRHTWVPHGLDAASYAAGQKAATLAAFHKLLPAHQAIGQVLAAVEGLGGRLEGEASQWRALQLQQSKTAAMVETTIQRLDTLDYMRIPQLQEKCEEAAGRGPNAAAEISDALHSLQQVLTALCAQQQLLLHLQQQQQQQQQGGQGGQGGCSLGLHLWRLLCAAAGYAQQVLSKADVAALFLSRKILLTEVPAARSRVWGLAQRGTAAVLFIGAVEGLWHAHQAAARRQLGERARDVLQPLGLTLQGARAAVWCSAAVLGVAGLKAACSATAEAGCQALGRLALLRLQLPRLRGKAWGGRRPRGSAGEQQGGGGAPTPHPGDV